MAVQMIEDLTQLVEGIAKRKERFTYDLRARCFVYDGIVAAYRAAQDTEHFTDLRAVIAHAMENDGMVGAWRDPATGTRYFDSCRLFTDEGNALAFAHRQRQMSVYNLNRQKELQVDKSVGTTPTPIS